MSWRREPRIALRAENPTQVSLLRANHDTLCTPADNPWVKLHQVNWLNE
jgi:hypothetical protein